MGHSMRFTDTISATRNLRVSPTFKQVAKPAANHEQGGMVNMLEVLLSNYCEYKGIVTFSSVAALDQTQKNQSAVLRRGRSYDFPLHWLEV